MVGKVGVEWRRAEADRSSLETALGGLYSTSDGHLSLAGSLSIATERGPNAMEGWPRILHTDLRLHPAKAVLAFVELTRLPPPILTAVSEQPRHGNVFYVLAVLLVCHCTSVKG